MESDLDRIDVQILDVLQNDGRLSNKELAAQIGLAPSSCLERVRRLQARGVLRGFHAEVSPQALGIGLEALIAIRLDRHSRARIDAFLEHLRSLPELIGFFHVAGANDFLVHVALRDPSHLRDLALDAFSQREEVAHIETSLIFYSERRTALPHVGLDPSIGS